jgi:hypothetical protein
LCDRGARNTERAWEDQEREEKKLQASVFRCDCCGDDRKKQYEQQQSTQNEGADMWVDELSIEVAYGSLPISHADRIPGKASR